MSLKSLEKNIEVKICGITRKEEIEFLNNKDISYIGFVFCKSKRQITIEKAKKLALKSKKKLVGVFRDNTLLEIQEVIKNITLDVIQLHGKEDSKYIENLRKVFKGEIWKGISIENEKDVEEANKCKGDKVLLDGKTPGSGKKFNHDLLKKIKRKYILAGGLTFENIEEVLKETNPYCIDVSSGVEDKGEKSEKLVDLLLERVKRNEGEI